MEKTVHHGRNIKRFREMLGIKQDALAAELGDDWTQGKISLLEQKEIVDDKLMQQIAGVFNVPAEAIKNFDEAAAIHNIQNNYDSSVINAGPTLNYQCHFNPLDKYIEAVDKILNLGEENKKLYERLLQSEKEKVEILKQAPADNSRIKSSLGNP